MRLLELQAVNVRNLVDVDLRFSPQCNLVCGSNGSGKSSLLEAIYLLGRGKSFRTHRLSRVTHFDQRAFAVRGRVQFEQRERRLAARYEHGGLQLTEGDTPLKRASDLIPLLPLTLISTDSHKLFSDGPKQRRKFIDWGVFHVEHLFLEEWGHYCRALSQRNALLRQARYGATLEAWDRELQRMAETIDQWRRAYVEALQQRFLSMLPLLLPLPGLSLSYVRGWPDDLDLHTHLKATHERDARLGYTRDGPHAADLLITLHAVPAQDCVSRGQQKLIISALYLAQAALFAERLDQPCVVLVDDLPAELDADRRQSLLEVLSQLRSQVFLTAIEDNSIDVNAFSEYQVFHVKQGVVRAA